MGSDLGDDGQPVTPAFNWDRRLDRGMDELVGIVRGVLADGQLVIQEIQFALDWLDRNDPVRKDFFGKQLHSAFRHALADGVLDADEEDALLDVLLRFIGGPPPKTHDASYSKTLPLDVPPPTVSLASSGFCFTGKFDYGTRQECHLAVISAGAFVHRYPTCETHYLVIGELGSRDWIHSNSGRKIERAIEIRTAGHPLKLIAEAHWCACLSDALKRRRDVAVDHREASPTVSRTVLPITSPARENQPLAGQTIVITGTMEQFDRKELEEMIVKLGGKASGSVSKKTSFVIAGESAGSKLDKAKALGVEVITEQQFFDRAGMKK
jgi:NAD-dependent DNA ligase